MRFVSNLGILSVSAAILLVGCSKPGDDHSPLASPSTLSNSSRAVVHTVASDYSSSALSFVQTKAPFANENNLLPTISDVGIVAFGNNLYRFERSNRDNIAKFDANSLGTNSVPVWQYSALDEGETGAANVHDLVFASETKAYMLRYEKTTAWIINPTATKANEFKIGELDLSEFADGDGTPEMEQGVIVGGKLFIIVQRLDTRNGWTPQEAYVVIVDTDSNTIIDAKLSDKSRAIPLAVQNPQSIIYNAFTGKIYVTATGSYVKSDENSGIEEIDPITFQHRVLVDNKNTNPQRPTIKKISSSLIVDGEHAYFVDYKSWISNSLMIFNPLTGAMNEAEATELKDINISFLSSDANGHLWVGDSTNHQIVVVNMKDNTVLEKIDTTLNPAQVVFIGN